MIGRVRSPRYGESLVRDRRDEVLRTRGSIDARVDRNAEIEVEQVAAIEVYLVALVLGLSESEGTKEEEDAKI